MYRSSVVFYQKQIMINKKKAYMRYGKYEKYEYVIQHYLYINAEIMNSCDRYRKIIYLSSIYLPFKSISFFSLCIIYIVLIP